MSVLVILPAYNEEESIERVVDNIVKKYPKYDYVIINDGSRDNTSKICHKNNYNIVDLPVNLGLEGAFQTGLKYANLKKYEYAIQIDADGQHNPDYIDIMLKKASEGFDIGSRFETEKKPWRPRMFGSRLIGTAIKLTTGKKLSDPTSGMRLYNRKMIKEFANNINYGPEPDTIAFLLKQGVNIASVQVTMEERMAGTSYLNFGKSIIYMLFNDYQILPITQNRYRGALL